MLSPMPTLPLVLPDPAKCQLVWEKRCSSRARHSGAWICRGTSSVELSSYSSRQSK
jgi:hypothetical protein